ncbi:MAG: aminopeptidase P family protein [Bacteroidales bacterium]|nr:aminopeptidase P family protein [Lachnoclostridium sp.]MCM1382990.1 aminopeptidase P family protein [Lachnoclostridium sp.]MCM1463956.1 aminopeptidase P family protein [Bacteroidales bacterium]
MENKQILDRLKKLRKAMKEAEIDFYMMPTADFHGSEYVSDYFKVREYFCGFSGSNGTLLVWQEGAGLWTDGRYFIQAQKELEGTGVTLFRMMEEGVPTITEFLRQNRKEGQSLGLDGRVISAAEGLKLERSFLTGQKAETEVCPIRYTRDLAGELWRDRPPFPTGKITVLDEKYAGKSVGEKLLQVREELQKQGAESLLLTKLDDLMWLFNIRGCDVECNPVAMCYGYLTQKEAVLFLQKKILTETEEAYFAGQGIEIREYGEITDYLEELSTESDGVLLDKRYCNYLLYKLLEKKHRLVEENNPTEMLKAVKNPVELAQMQDIFLKDSVAVTKFIYWLKTNIGKTEITEVSAAQKLEEFRRQIPGFLGLSFPTIAAYGENAAMMHYEASDENCAVLKPEGLFLVDSGGQYMGGTTDVTRTIVLGPVSEEEKYHYTLTAIANLRLSKAHWLYGCTGRNLDILARQPLWNAGLDYKCGTGHGVGYMLNVHEGPQSMRWRFVKGAQEAVLEEGMDITNEPGVYVEGSHGIRIENVMVVKKDVKNEYGQFMHFETLTWVPFDFEAINEKDMPTEDWMFLLAYQKEVYEKIAPFLDEKERDWLKKETRADSTVRLSL